jgi:multiple antibiotic resistance protein
MTINEMFLFVMGLIAIFSPFGVIGPYGGFVSQYPKDVQGSVAWRVALNVCIVLLASGWGGQYFLTFLGITLPALTTTGGFILLITSMPMVMKGNVHRENENLLQAPVETWKKIVVVPLTFPITMGAGMISYVIACFAQANKASERVVLTGLLILGCFLMWMTYIFAGPLIKRLSVHSMDIFVRIGGIILMSLAFMLLARGITELIPGLAK